MSRREKNWRLSASLRQKLRFKVWSDLVGNRADAWADGGADALALGAETFHPGNRTLDDAVDCAAPTGVCGGDDARYGISQQHRGAIGRQHADDEPRRSRDDRVGTRQHISRDRAGNLERRRPVLLIESYDAVAAAAEMACDEAAIFKHR